MGASRASIHPCPVFCEVNNPVAYVWEIKDIRGWFSYVEEMKELGEFVGDGLAHPAPCLGSVGILPARKRDGTLAGRMPALPGMTTYGCTPGILRRVRNWREGRGIGVRRKRKECASL